MLLSDELISLRPPESKDKKDIALLANNKKIYDNLKDYFPFPYLEENAEEFISLTQKENPALSFAIEYKGELCGVAGLVPQTDVYSRSAEIGYWIGEPYWNKGIASVAVKLLTDYGFNQLKLIRLYTGIFEYNIVSMRVLEKNGFEKEGIFKKSVLKNGKIWNEHRYAKIK